MNQNSFSFESYSNFTDAIKNVNDANKSIENTEKSIKECQSQLEDESIFMGPIADSCKKEFKNIAVQITSMKESLNNTANSLSNISENYKNAENTGSKKIIETDIKNLVTDKKNINVNSIQSGSNVASALSKYKDELENSEYATVNDKIFTTTTNEMINGQPVKVTHVVINNPNQINGAPANGGYKKGLEKSSSAAKRLNAEILVNGSHFKYSNGAEDLQCHNNIAIVNGEVKASGKSGGHELLIDKNGNIYNTNGKSAQKLLNNGVKYSFSCHSTQVLVNGSIEPSYKEKHLYKRTVIGQNAPCEYYIITDTNYNNKLSNTAKYLKSLGCKNAYSLDQGGSVSLVRKGQLINNPSDKNGERAVGDFLYFTS